MTIRLKDNEKIVQEMINYRSKGGETVQTIALFFDINQKITNKTRIFMHFVPRNRQKPLSLQAVNKYQQVMNDLIKVNTMSENMALNKCQEILNDRREALASKAKKND